MQKDLEVPKIVLTFATAFRLKNEKRVLKKKFENFLRKNLVVSKIVLTFATAFRFKKSGQNLGGFNPSTETENVLNKYRTTFFEDIEQQSFIYSF